MSALKFLAENRTAAIVTAGAAIVGGAMVYFVMNSSSPTPAPTPPPVTMVVIQPPKPPPPPPPLPQPKTISPPKMATPVSRPVTPATPPKAASPSPSHLGTSIHGNAPDAFNLTGSGNGMDPFGSGDGDGTCTQFCGYSATAIPQLQGELSNNPITRYATAGLQADVYVDANGVVTRVVLTKLSGDPAVDRVVYQILTHAKLDPPPAGMPMPINFRTTGEPPL